MKSIPLLGLLAALKLRSVLWLLGVLLATGISALVPPMASPDETTHITRAYLISRGTLLIQPPGDGVPDDAGVAANLKAFFAPTRVGGMVDQRLAVFVDIYSYLISHRERLVTPAEQKQLDAFAWSDAKSFYAMQGTGYYFPAIYAPQALALALGQTFDLSLPNAYQLTRSLTLLTCFALLGLAFRAVPPNPFVVAVLLLPMSVFQMVSPTLDGLSNALAVLCISLFLKALDAREPPSAKLSWGLALSLFLLATSRTHLLPLLLLPFFVAWRHQSRRDFYLGCAVSAGALAWTLFALLSVSDLRIARQLSTTQLLLFYAADPMAFVRVVQATIVDQFDFFQLSFIGLLGWLDTRLPLASYDTLTWGLAAAALVTLSVAELRENWSQRLALLALALASVGLIFLALLVTWTPHPATIVQGVQGRYFVVPALLLGFAANPSTATPSRLRKWLTGLVLAAFALCSLDALLQTLVSRYH